MPDILPTINNEPAQGIQALLDTVYLWNPDVANNLIEQVNELLEELGELSNISGAIKPYSQLEAPVRQYMPMSYNDGVYVANEEMTTLPATPDLSKWTLIATKIDESAITQQINSAVGGEAGLRQQADNALQGNIDTEERARIAADQGLQTQIDAISAASDVKDVVGTYQELENYDTSTLGNNDIIKVLQDETQEDATTYYRWIAAEDEFQLIGEEGPYYTKAQTDTLLEAKQDIMQFATMPVADASNAGKVVQYVGEDTEAYTHGYIYQNQPTYTNPSATIAQTVGGDSISFETTSGDTTISGDIQAFNNLLTDIGWTPSDVPSNGTLMFTRSESDDAWYLEMPLSGWGDYYAQEFLEEMGFVFTGTPVDGDAITATYHFSLSDLSVDLNTFVGAEQPSGSETVSFVATVYDDYRLDPTSFEVEGETLTVDPATFLQAYRNHYGDPDNVYLFEVEVQSGSFYMMVYYTGGSFDTWFDPAEFGFSYTGDLSELTTTTICNINCIEPGAHWYKNGSLVDMAEYGISYDGEPEDGDTITVTYTAPFIDGYVWNQINVQPGGAGGINWAGQWDKPAETTWTYYYPHYTVPTLPDGNYEFFIQNKSLYQYSSGVQTWSYKTFKVSFGIANHRARGLVTWVLDGGTDFFSYNLSNIVSVTHWSTYDQPNPQDILTIDLVGACRIGNATVRTSDVEGVFRWTNIRNTDTGEEIPVEVEVLQSQTGYGNQIGYYNSGNPVNPPYIPEASVYTTGNCDDFTQYIMLSDPLLPLVDTVAQCGSFEIVLKDDDGSEWRCVVENNIDSYIARVLKASGIFENTQLGWTEGVNTGSTCVFLNTPAGTEKTIKMWGTVYGSRVSANLWMVQSVANFTPALVTRPGSLVTADNFGLIEQYTGETDANYTNGYFYKATGTKVNVPESIATTTVSPAGEATITIDLTNWIDAIVRTYGWTPETVREWLVTYTSIVWNLSYNVDNGEVTRMYMPWYGDTYEPDILQYVTVAYSGSQEGEVWVEFEEQYTKAHTEIQNGHWERIDVQPGGGGGSLPDPTGHSGDVLGTDGFVAGWVTPTTITFRTWEAHE